MRKIIGLAAGLGTTLLLCSCLSTSKNVVYEDERVVVTERVSFYVIPPNVHAGSDTISMRLFGKRYKEVRGTPPYYLEIPGTESILFVTGRDYDEGQATVHIVDLKTKKRFSFAAHDSHIGSDIGAGEFIEGLGDGKFIVSSERFNCRFTNYLDLKTKKLEKEAGVTWDSIIGTNYYVFPRGKAPKY